MSTLPTMIPLLADAAAEWTTKELLTAIGSAVVLVSSVSLFLLRVLTASAKRKARVLGQENARLKKEMAELIDNKSPFITVTELEQKLKEAEVHAGQLEADLASEKSVCVKEQESAGRLRDELVEMENGLAAAQRRISKALQKDGQTWTERVLGSAPDFKPLDPEERRTPVISVLNLKGGVGKTTITANLAAALDRRGYRVLLLDLDLQGSLTSLFMKEGDHEALFKQGKMLGEFLASAFEAEHPNLLNYVQPILPDGKSALVPTADDLAYAEMNLTIRWLLRDERRDPRFLLRKELQLKRITNSYDIVLLDCPPLINVCCVNALAASDYVLAPILPSKQATARVPVLLARLKEFKENINSTLKIMGIICNRTQRSELTAEEETRLNLLGDRCFDVWGERVPQFDTFVRQSREVRIAEDQRRPLGDEDEMRPVFDDLAVEVEGRLPLFCRAASRKTAAQKEAVS
jgi:cellulose biosynthesis protein BcsQ